MSHVIHHANIKDWAMNYSGELFDGILCDPPYELGFMGKSWDSSGIAFDVDMWKSIYDLLKPGAHLLAFSGSRTYHRMAVAIEDAGFEIRDMIEYIYGSGFPKSLNVEKQLEKMLDEKRAKQNTERGVRPMPDTDVSQTISTESEAELVLQPSVSKQSVHGTMQGQEPSQSTQTREEPSMERRSDTQAAKGELQRCPLCEMPSGIFANGSQGRLHNGTQASDGSTPKQDANTNRSGASHRPQTKQQRAIELEAICNECRTQAIRGARGIGSALKPAHEPICLARKPLDGTIGQNFLKHGTGGLNIDGTRINYASDADKQSSKPGSLTYNADKRANIGLAGGIKGMIENNSGQWEQPPGRFPANLIHDGSDEVEEIFPQTKSGNVKPHKQANSTLYKHGSITSGGLITGSHTGDSGSASRFFYCAKASKSERNAGLEGFEAKEAPYKYGSIKKSEGRTGVNTPQSNHHPTVKPLSLTKYLATLIKPPTGGRLLVPFSGSGSEMIGALQAGWEHVEGVELTEEYIPIAEARIEYWLNVKEEESKQVALV